MRGRMCGCALGVVVACGGGGPSPLGGDSGGIEGFGADTEEDEVTETVGSDDAAATDDDPLRFDAGGEGSGGSIDPDADRGCKKVDMLMAIDNSSSMSEEIDALRGPVFASFPNALLQEVGDGLDDFQLAVIDACPKPARFHNWGAGGDCAFSSGTNYMLSASPGLADEFACVTDLTVNGWNNTPDTCDDDLDDDEQPALTSAWAIALSVENDEGFLRDDAILFIVAITDEDEAAVDASGADEIYAQIIATKGGDVGKIVFLGIAGASDCSGVYGSADDATLLQEVTQRFEAQGQGLFWDLCEGDLEEGFLEVIGGALDQSCHDFQPEG